MPRFFPIDFYCLAAVVEFRYQHRRHCGRWRGWTMVTALSLSAIVVVTASQYAVVPKLTNNPFFDIVREGCQDRAVQLGVECVYTGTVEQDEAGQIELLRTLLSNETIAGIAISVPSQDNDELKALIDTATIPIVTFDSDYPHSRRISYVGTDNFFFGQQLAKLLRQLVPQGGKYGILYSTEPNIVERAEAFTAEVAAYEALHKNKNAANDQKLWHPVGIEPGDVDTVGTSAWADFGTNLTLSHELMRQLALNGATAIVPMRGAPMRSGFWKDFVHEFPNVTLVCGDALPNQLELLNRNFVHGLVGQLPYEMGAFAIQTLHDLVVKEIVPPSFVGTNVLTHVKVPLILPELVVDENRIGSLKIAGYGMFSVVTVTCLGMVAWMYRNRQLRVVKAAQPIFLLMVVIGVFTMSTVLIPLSMDDGGTRQDPTAICMAVPWFGTVGFCTAFSALFSKTLRINKIVKATQSMIRIKVTERDVMIPFAAMLFANIIVLTVWTVVDPLVYLRQAHDGTDGWNRVISTYGLCQSHNVMRFVLPLVIINVTLLGISNWQAYEARSIQSEFSEAKYIGYAMASILQISLMGVPLLFVVREQPQAFFLVIIVLVFTIAMSTILLIFVPKIFHAHHFQQLSPGEQRRAMRNSIRISSRNLSRSDPASYGYNNDSFGDNNDYDGVGFGSKHNALSSKASSLDMFPSPPNRKTATTTKDNVYRDPNLPNEESNSRDATEESKDLTGSSRNEHSAKLDESGQDVPVEKSDTGKNISTTMQLASGNDVTREENTRNLGAAAAAPEKPLYSAANDEITC